MGTKQVDGLMVVPEHQGRAGAVTWWRLQGDVDYATLERVWVEAGFAVEDLPSPTSDSVALRRALERYRDSKTLVRPHPTGGFSVVDELYDEESEELDYTTRFTAWIDYEAQSLLFDREVDDEIADAIVAAFEEQRGRLSASDLSSWMVRRARALSAVALRDTGGIYFIPEPTAPTWSAFADVVAQVSASRVYELPALKTERAVEALLEAVIAEAAEETRKLEEALDAADEHTARGLKGKASRCKAIADKLRLYEDLLGVRMPNISERVTELDARIVEATLVAAG